jgi:uncharacterized coiled-coil DUF342 family protein
MTASDLTLTLRTKLISRITAAQKKADAAKKAAKLAKLAYRQAKQKVKEVKRVAKKLRKEVKALKNELASLAVKKTRPQAAKKKSSPRRRPVTAVAPVVSAEVVPAPAESSPTLPQ